MFRYGKKHIVKIVTILVTVLLKMTHVYVFTLYLQKPHYFKSLSKIHTLNFTMYNLTIFTCRLKIYVVRLHNLISMNILFTIDHKRSNVFFIIVKRKPKPVSVNIFFTIKITGHTED